MDRRSFLIGTGSVAAAGFLPNVAPAGLIEKPVLIPPITTAKVIVRDSEFAVRSTVNSHYAIKIKWKYTVPNFLPVCTETEYYYIAGDPTCIFDLNDPRHRRITEEEYEQMTGYSEQYINRYAV